MVAPANLRPADRAVPPCFPQVVQLNGRSSAVVTPDRGIHDRKGTLTMPHGEGASLELRVRKAVLQRLLRGEPVDLAALSTSTRLRPDEVAQALSKLSELGALHFMDGMLIAAYPLSGVATRHRVRRDGMIIYATEFLPLRSLLHLTRDGGKVDHGTPGHVCALGGGRPCPGPLDEPAEWWGRAARLTFTTISIWGGNKIAGL